MLSVSSRSVVRCGSSMSLIVVNSLVRRKDPSLKKYAAVTKYMKVLMRREGSFWNWLTTQPRTEAPISSMTDWTRSVMAEGRLKSSMMNPVLPERVSIKPWRLDVTVETLDVMP